MSERPDIEAIKQRADAATPGPWSSKRETTVELFGDPVVLWGDGGYCFVTQPTAEFIAHARTDVPVLIAYVSRLEAAVKVARRFANGQGRSAHLSESEWAIYCAALDELRTALIEDALAAAHQENKESPDGN